MTFSWWCFQDELYLPLQAHLENKKRLCQSATYSILNIACRSSGSSSIEKKYLPCRHCLIASSLFYYINSHCYKFATRHKKIASMQPTQYIHAFFTRINPWKFGKKYLNWQSFQHSLKPCPFYISIWVATFNKSQTTLPIQFFFTKLSRIDPCEKRVNILGGQHWHNFLMACSNLVTMAIYVVKQAWCNEIMPTVWTFYPNKPTLVQDLYLKQQGTFWKIFWTNYLNDVMVHLFGNRHIFGLFRILGYSPPPG